MRADERVRETIDRAYEVFGRYGCPSTLHASPLRDADEILRTLTQVPLKDLSGEAIGPYAGWALTTVGDVDDYKHFLPRILEQAVTLDVWMGTTPPVIAERLKRANWRDWPADEQAAIVSVFTVSWAQASHRRPDELDASDWLCGIAALGLDISVHLATWLEPPTKESALQIAAFLSKAPARIVGSHGASDAYWGYVDEATCRSIGDWLASDDVSDALVRAVDEADADDQWQLESGLDAAALVQR